MGNTFIVASDGSILSWWSTEEEAIEEAIRVSEFTQIRAHVFKLLHECLRGAKAPEDNAK